MTRAVWRALVTTVLVWAGAGVGIGLLFFAAGYGPRIDVFAAAGFVVGVVVWFARNLLIGPGEDDATEPTAPVGGASVNLDRRTRQLESQVRGVHARLGLTVTTLHETVRALSDELSGGTPLPPRLEQYVRSEPRALSRAQLRMILQELSTL